MLSCPHGSFVKQCFNIDSTADLLFIYSRGPYSKNSWKNIEKCRTHEPVLIALLMKNLVGRFTFHFLTLTLETTESYLNAKEKGRRKIKAIVFPIAFPMRWNQTGEKSFSHILPQKINYLNKIVPNYICLFS